MQCLNDLDALLLDTPRVRKADARFAADFIAAPPGDVERRENLTFSLLQFGIASDILGHIRQQGTDRTKGTNNDRQSDD